ncbi:MAG: exonuclease, partial [Planctomycetota bacterium]
MPEIFFSTDIETDGPIPGPNSMLSMATAAYDADKNLLGTYSANLDLLEGAKGDPRTMEWWQTQPKAWEACRADTRPPSQVMPSYIKWVRSFKGSRVFVAYPAGFDFSWVYWYLIRFASESPFSHSALDIKTLA